MTPAPPVTRHAVIKGLLIAGERGLTPPARQACAWILKSRTLAVAHVLDHLAVVGLLGGGQLGRVPAQLLRLPQRLGGGAALPPQDLHLGPVGAARRRRHLPD